MGYGSLEFWIVSFKAKRVLGAFRSKVTVVYECVLLLKLGPLRFSACFFTGSVEYSELTDDVWYWRLFHDESVSFALVALFRVHAGITKLRKRLIAIKTQWLCLIPLKVIFLKKLLIILALIVFYFAVEVFTHEELEFSIFC